MPNEVMIPPWVLPESPEVIRWIDDATIVHAPAFGRGMTQRGSWGDPRWGLRRRYRGLTSDQKAAILACLNESRGQLNRILVTPHAPLRGTFPTSELLSNGSFSSGTTGWSCGTKCALSVSDRTMIVTRVQGGSAENFLFPSSAVTVVANAPYVARFFVRQGRGAFSSGFRIDDDSNSVTGSTISFGLISQVFVPATISCTPDIQDGESSGILAGDYLLVPYASLSRCALADNGQNLLTQSDVFGNAAWTKTRSSVVSDSIAAPDGTITADKLIEDSTASSSHFAIQDSTVAGSAADYSFSVALQAGTRTRAAICVVEGTSSHEMRAWINLSTGAVGTVTTTGANWTNIRAFATAMGGSWYVLTIVGRKASASTQVQPYIALATSDGALSYSGDGVSYIYAWRATLAQSSVPARLMQTTSAASTGTSPTGSAIYVKGLPASTNGLLEVGDWIEVASQLKQVTARLNSDAAGLGYLQFRPALGDSPADNDPVIINQPFGRFIYSGQQKELQNMFGLYGDIEMDLEEVYT